MTWITYAAITSLALAGADLCIKVASGRISSSLGLLLYGSCTFLAGLSWVAWQHLHGPAFRGQALGIAAGVGVGVCFTTVTVGLYLTFGAGAPVSLASPLVRLGGLVVASVVGIAAFGEPLTLRYAGGVLLTLAGLYLILTR